MFIVKISSRDKVPSILSPMDGYTEVETMPEAEALYKKFTNEYPGFLKVQIFEAKEIHMPESIREEALARKKKRYYIQNELRKMGIHEIVIQSLELEEEVYRA